MIEERKWIKVSFQSLEMDHPKRFERILPFKWDITDLHPILYSSHSLHRNILVVVFQSTFIAESQSGQQAFCQILGGDPGYDETGLSLVSVSSHRFLMYLFSQDGIRSSALFVKREAQGFFPMSRRCCHPFCCIRWFTHLIIESKWSPNQAYFISFVFFIMKCLFK